MIYYCMFKLHITFPFSPSAKCFVFRSGHSLLEMEYVFRDPSTFLQWSSAKKGTYGVTQLSTISRTRDQDVAGI